MIAITDSTQKISQLLIEALLEKGFVLNVFKSNQLENLSAKIINHQNINWIEGSILDVTSLEQLLEGAEIVYHLAELKTFDRKQRNQMYKINVEGTANVVNVAIDFNVTKIVFRSSYLALGDKPNNGIYDEETKWNEIADANGYGWSKHLAEREIWRCVNEGVNGVILNVGQILGDSLQQSELLELYHYFDKKQSVTNANFPFIDELDLLKILIQSKEDNIENSNVLIYHKAITYQYFMHVLGVLKNDDKQSNFLSLSHLRRRANIVRWIPFYKTNKAMLNYNLLNEITTEKQYSNQKLKSLFDIEFTNEQLTYSKIAKIVKA